MAPTLTPCALARLQKRRTVSALRCAAITATAAASSSENETPTMVFTSVTEASPYVLNNGSSSKKTPTRNDGIVGTTKATGRKIALAQLEQSFPSSQNPSLSSPGSNSPGSRAEQSLAEDDEDGDDSSRDSRESATQDDDLTHDLKEAKTRQVVSVIQDVLETGIASICRLRQISPPRFFQKMEVSGTTVTRFNIGALRKMSDLNVDEYYSDDYEEEEDKKSMVKSVNTKHSSQQKSISPFTAHSQKSRSRHHLDQNNRPVNTNIKERLMAMEALLLLR